MPSAGGFSFARFTIGAKPGSKLPSRLRLQLLNRARLPKTLVLVAVAAPLKGRRHGFDLFVAAITKRAVRKPATASEEPPDALLGILKGFGGLLARTGAYPWLTAKWAAHVSENQRTNEIAREEAKQLDQGLDAVVDNPAIEFFALDPPTETDPEVLKLIRELTSLIDTAARQPPGKFDPAVQLAGIIAQIEETIDNDLNGDGTIGPPPPTPPPPPPPPPPPAVYDYSIPAFAVSFTGPAANLSPDVTDEFTPTQGCGDPARNSWLIPTKTTGLAVPPTTNVANFTQQNPFTLIQHNFNANGAVTGGIQIKLDYAAGPPPTITVETPTSGDITNVVAPAEPLPVTLTKVAAC